MWQEPQHIPHFAKAYQQSPGKARPRASTRPVLLPGLLPSAPAAETPKPQPSSCPGSTLQRHNRKTRLPNAYPQAMRHMHLFQERKIPVLTSHLLTASTPCWCGEGKVGESIPWDIWIYLPCSPTSGRKNTITLPWLPVMLNANHTNNSFIYTMAVRVKVEGSAIFESRQEIK